MSNHAHIWYSFSGRDYEGAEPAFYDATQFQWAKKTASEISELRLNSTSFTNKFTEQALPYFVKDLVSKTDAWKQTTFYFWGNRNAEACAQSPELDAIIRSIPGMLSAGISILEADTHVLPHYGDTNSVVRCHFGLSVPASLPECGIKVKGESRSWSEHAWLMFCDAHKHEAWNKSTQRRTVLIVDVLSPEYSSRKKEICCNVKSMHSLQRAEENLPVIKNLPGFVRGLIRKWFLMKHYLRYSDAY
jgi:aspartyl/asparaginyl beta-hydroxylase (cupin superfamily)